MPTLDWLNRAEALTIADKVPYCVLEPVSEHGEDNAENLLIQGDNLDALKALLPFYRGRVKCIFIDPPYNTKSAFEHYDDNLEHSQWLSMMQPRLTLLRELLTEDGSIWVTIDDNEGHYLKVLMDEVFGRQNFVANVVWQKKYAVASDAKGFSDFHDHLFVYTKNGLFQRNLLPRTDKQDSLYKYNDNDGNGSWRTDNLSVKTYSENYDYPLRNPKTGKEYWPPKGRCWYTSRENMALLLANNGIYFGKDGLGAPQLKRYLARVQSGVVPSTWWTHEDAGHNDESRKESKVLFATEDPFSTPKPERLLQRILNIATNPNDLILDSFLGSGTTAAVAHKMGRRWIGIEMGGHAVTHCIPRLQKVIAGEQGGISQAVNWQGGGGFRFLRLGEPMFTATGGIHPAVRFNTLASFIWMQETGAPLAQTRPSPGLSATLSPPAGRGEAQADAAREDVAATLSPPVGRRQDEGLPLLGVHEGRAIYLLFNGILGDKRPASGNVLTHDVLATIDQLCPHEGPKLIYGEACRLGEKRLAAAGVTFKHIPYDVKAR